MKKLALHLTLLMGSIALLSQPGHQKDHYSFPEGPVFETPDLRGEYQGQILNSWRIEQLPPAQIAIDMNDTNPILKESFDHQNAHSVTFTIDMTDAIAEGAVEFKPDIHSVYISGTFAQWAQPGSNSAFKLSPVSKASTNKFSGYQKDEEIKIYSITLDVEDGEHFYKFFLVGSSPTWNMGEWAGDPNRSVIISDDVVIENVWGQLNTYFAGGTGVAWNPYRVATAVHLDNVRLVPEASFMQVADIDLGQAPWNEGAGWLPLGNAKNPFSGNYNGNGYAIQNLTINRPEEEFIGLFGRIAYGTLTNVQLKNASITAKNRAGILCGATYQSSIHNCSAQGNVLAMGNWAGGLVGVNHYFSTISLSYAAVDIVANGYSAGGFSGTNENGSYILSCYATGDVTGLRNVGGLIGWMSGNSQVEFCYSTGYIFSDLYTGGLIGREDGYNYTNFSYWNEETSGQNTSTGGVPLNTLQMLQSSSFEDWDFVETWKINAGHTYPYFQYQKDPGAFNYPLLYLSPSNLQSTCSDKHITISWKAPTIGSPTGYKLFRDGELLSKLTSDVTSYDDTGRENYIIHTYYLIAEYGDMESKPSAKINTFAHKGFAKGNGTPEDPFQVSTPGELFTVRLYMESFFLQVADIDMTDSEWDGDEGWQPIGSQSEGFQGVYDGDNHTVSNLYINRDINMYQGLFCHNQGFIVNLKLVDAQINAPLGMAGILAGTNYGQIMNCHTTGQISSSGTFGRLGGLTGWNAGSIFESGSSAQINTVGQVVGGLTGANVEGFIGNSWSEGNISAGSMAGGLTGINQRSAMIMGSFANTQVIATGDNIGGLAGSSINSFISDCYSTGNVSGNRFAGGLVGYTRTDNFIINCYSTGEVSANEHSGGLVALNENPENFENIENIERSFWDTYTSGQIASAGGSPKNTREMVKKETFNEWDFNEAWGIEENQTYPYLLWQGEPGLHNIPKEIPSFYYLTLTANPPVGGTVGGTGSFVPGQVVNIFATPNPGYRFINWSGHTTYVDFPDHDSCKVTMPAENIVLVANFEEFVNVEEKHLFGIKVYPNPATHKLCIEFENVTGGQVLIQIINVLGQEVLKQDVNLPGKVLLDFDVSSLKAGIYLLNIRSQSEAFSKKIIFGD